MREATQVKKKSKRPANGKSDESSDDQPSLAERAQSGMRIAEQLGKAAAGGKLRQGFSLWRVSRELPTAAAGTGRFFKRHPVPIAVAGGVLTTGALLLLALGLGAFDEQHAPQADAGDEAEPDSGEEEPAEDEE
jgi:hypothetical protein